MKGGKREGSGRKPTGKTKKNITLYLSDKEKELLDEKAKAEGLSLSRYIVAKLL